MKLKSKIGYMACQDRYSMEDLLDFAIQAENAGFKECMIGDHFHPWWHDGGYGNFTWVWLAAAAERTRTMKYVTGVTSAVFRYNPPVIAQAFASLDVLYPGRIALGIGSGEAMNEVAVGFDWAPAKVRLDRTREAIHIISSLWKRKVPPLEGTEQIIDDDGFLTFTGKYFKTNRAHLYTPPRTRIPLYMAAVGREATKIAAIYSDGLITVFKPDYAKTIFDILDKYVLANGKDPTSFEKIGKPKISYNQDYDKAFNWAESRRASCLKNAYNLKISDPRELQEAAKREVKDEEIKKSTLILTSIEDCIGTIEKYFEAGYTKIFIHSVSPDEPEFIERFSKKVLPYFDCQK